MGGNALGVCCAAAQPVTFETGVERLLQIKKSVLRGDIWPSVLPPRVSAEGTLGWKPLALRANPVAGLSAQSPCGSLVRSRHAVMQKAERHFGLPTVP